MNDQERWDLLLGLVAAAIDQHDRWASRTDLAYVTAGVDEAMSDLVDGFAEGTIPGDCRQLEELVGAFGARWQDWQAKVDRRGGSATIPPSEEAWKTWEAVVACHRGITEPARRAIESVAALREQQVGDRQICEIYGWLDQRGNAETWKIEEELAKPGKHTKDWVDPVTRRRQEAAEKERTLAERVKALRERKLARMSAECPEALDELVRQGVPLSQIAGMLRITEEEVLARCDAEGLPRPPVGPSVHAMPSPHEPEMSEPMARQFAAQEADRDRQEAEEPVERGVSPLEASKPVVQELALSLEQQIVQLHEGGFEAGDIAAELSSPGQKLTKRKVEAVLKRYADDPDAIGVPGAKGN